MLLLSSVVQLGCNLEPRYDGRALSDWARVLDHSQRSSVAERLAAVDALTHIALRSETAVQLLGRALRDEDAQVRLAAVTGLALLGERARTVVGAIDSIARNDPDAGVRREAATARQLAKSQP